MKEKRLIGAPFLHRAISVHNNYAEAIVNLDSCRTKCFSHYILFY